MTSMKFTLSLPGIGLAMALAAGSATAAPVFFSPITGFEDDDLEWHVDPNGNGILEIGERITGVAEINSTFGVFGGGSADLVGEELTIVFDITVATKVATADPGQFDFTFVPTAGGGNLSGLVPAGDLGQAMVALFLDGDPELDIVGQSCGSLAACITEASDGALWATFGFDGDADEVWEVLSVPDVTGSLNSVPGNTVAGFFNNALSLLTNNTGATILEQSCPGGLGIPGCNVAGDDLIEWIGSGTINGGQGLTSGAFSRSDFQFQLAVVPEPASLMLLGSGLFTMMGFSRLRRRRS